MSKLVLEIKKPLKNNDILIYKDGEFIPSSIDILFVRIKEKVKELKEELEQIKEENKQFKNEILGKEAEQDTLINKNAHDILVDRGIIDEE